MIMRRALSAVWQLLLICWFRLLELTLPTRSVNWCFCTWPGTYSHTMDNPRAVFEIVKDDPTLRKIILRKPGQDPANSVVEGRNVVVVNVETLRGAYYLATAGFLLTGYGLGGVCSYSRWISTKHKIIQLWHGIPLKRIGKLFAGETHWDAETPKYAATVCSSPRDQEIMAAAFAPLATEQVWLTGLPRNDTILKPEAQLPIDYRNHLSRLRERLAGRRFVLYAPTWRASEIGIYPFSDQERAALQALLKKHNVALGIRAHANRRVQDAYSDILEGGAVFFVNDFPDVNVLLRQTDVLITDYSSIYIDFLLTGRPSLHFTYDIDEYVNERGFLYDLEEALPSAWFKSVEELLTNLDRALSGEAGEADRYARVKRLFHAHDAQSGRQVVERMQALLRR